MLIAIASQNSPSPPRLYVLARNDIKQEANIVLYYTFLGMSLGTTIRAGASNKIQGRTRE